MKTPFIQFRQDVIATLSHAISAHLGAFGRRWMPELSGSLPSEILSVVNQATTGASCRTTGDAMALAAAGFSSVLISRPVVDPEALYELANLARSCELTCVVDHFRHAELLSNALRLRQASSRILINVEAGNQLTGVRPGPDATRLASATSQLSGLQIVGVFIDDAASELQDPTCAEPSTVPSFRDLQTVAAHCRRMIRSTGVACSELVTGREQLDALSENSDATTCLLSPLVCDVASQRGLGIAPSLQSTLRSDDEPRRVVSRVLSRPTLETCVIDFGCGRKSFEAPTVIHPPGARFARIADDASALTLSGASLDLKIGDFVELCADWRSCLDLPSVIKTGP